VRESDHDCATEIDSLDCAEENLERLDNGAGDCSAGNRDLMAAQAIQTVLVEPIAAERTRPPASKCGDPQVSQNHGYGQSTMGSATRAWGIAEAWV